MKAGFMSMGGRVGIKQQHVLRDSINSKCIRLSDDSCA